MRVNSSFRSGPKAMKILFTHAYFLQFDPKQVQHARPYPPLGTILAASYMRQQNYDVRLFDTMFVQNPDDITHSIENFKPDLLVIYDDGFNYLTKMCLSNMRDAAFRMQGLAKSSGCKIIVSSSDATDHFEKYLNAGADFVILGEAEETLLALVNSLNQNESEFNHINGLAYFKNQSIVKTDKRAVMKSPDKLPLPAWDLIDIAPYKKVWINNHGYLSLNIATTRGCPYSCNWCAKPIYGNSYIMRSPENVVKEIKLLKQLFGPDHIWFCDDIFGLKRSWVSQFNALLNKENLKIKYKIQSRADLLVQEKYVEDLAQSGCEEVWLGAESGSQKILDAMDKGTTVEEIKKARQLLQSFGIKACFFIQYGYPGENANDIKKTIKLIKETTPDDIGISVSYPLPGTLFYDRVKSQLKEKTNWTDSDELALLFKNTYEPGFYKVLHRYTHAIFRKNKAIEKWRKKNGPAVKSMAALSYIKQHIRAKYLATQLKNLD